MCPQMLNDINDVMNGLPWMCNKMVPNILQLLKLWHGSDDTPDFIEPVDWPTKSPDLNTESRLLYMKHTFERSSVKTFSNQRHWRLQVCSHWSLEFHRSSYNSLGNSCMSEKTSTLRKWWLTFEHFVELFNGVIQKIIVRFSSYIFKVCFQILDFFCWSTCIFLTKRCLLWDVV